MLDSFLSFLWFWLVACGVISNIAVIALAYALFTETTPFNKDLYDE